MKVFVMGIRVESEVRPHSYSGLFGHPPDISKARVFGADIQKGITDRACKHIFCGIAQNSDGWICLSPSESEFFTTTHASFNEDLSQRRFEFSNIRILPSSDSIVGPGAIQNS